MVREKMGEIKSRGGEGEEGLCTSKNCFKSHGPGPSLTLRQIDALGIMYCFFCFYLNQTQFEIFIVQLITVMDFSSAALDA